MSIHYQDDRVTLHHGDVVDVGRTLEPGSVRTIVTSPPYYGLRDYDGQDQQIGGEETVDEYVENLVDVFHVLRRVLADDGTLWLNLGDSYSSSGGMQGVGINAKVGNTRAQAQNRTRPRSDLPPKNLLGVPWRVALALQADGWMLRSEIIWQKPNAMPESVTDRPSKSHEHVFLLTKSARYYYDAEAVLEDASPDNIADMAGRKAMDNKSDHGGTRPDLARSREEYVRADGKRNRRDVWSIPTRPFAGAHFAVFPEELARLPILAGSQVGDTVLDPFSGSGTTGKVALDHGRNYVGIDLSEKYLDLSIATRFAHQTLDVWGGAAS